LKVIYYENNKIINIFGIWFRILKKNTKTNEIQKKIYINDTRSG